tara:strand:- start:14358 stop:14930 length:573 start_codon:yes stop_codon:yes gene_type:complete
MNIVYNKGYFYVPVEKPNFKILAKNSKELEQKKFERDGHEWHITIISAIELNNVIRNIKAKNQELSKKQVKKQIKNKIISNIKENVRTTPTYKGVGAVKEEDNIAYFVVVDWPEMQNVRHSIKLPSKDFHVTLGFKNNDIHGIPKDKSTLINEISCTESDDENDKEKAQAEKKEKMRNLTLRAYWDQLYD